MNYTEIIKNLRIDRDLTQTKIAAIIGVSQRAYSDYENGKVRIPVEALMALAKYYDVDMNYICGVASKRNPYPGKR